MNGSHDFPLGKMRPAAMPGAKSGLEQIHDGRAPIVAQSTIARGRLPRSQAWKSHAGKAQTTSALEPLTTQQLTRECQVLALAFSTREVVEDTQASLRAVENVRNGESGMSLKTFVNLCRANPRARALAAPLLGYGDECDPDVVQAISVLLNQLVRDDSPHCAGDGGDDVAGDLFGDGGARIGGRE